MGHIKIRKALGTWTVRAGGAVLAETANGLELTEGSHPPVIYFPRSDIAMAFLDNSEQTTKCPHKGQASYYHIVTKSKTLENAAWSFDDPNPVAAAIKGHLAFHPSDTVTVERV
ncbi:DUF427 domain-containing protein [Roseovarius sp. ZX-A-9]|uniref:DUF427 domain-containing protein n=1 Tax=Roseovarius sp. ZX-A-9 TaxID=3014783 RepID=UPI0023309A79|nr:DUF427 domain-containing protein [Roseovarius sp. ZX-A-9]